MTRHAVAWDLHYPPVDPIETEAPGELPPWASPPRRPLAVPALAFAQRTAGLHSRLQRAAAELEAAGTKLEYLRKAVFETPAAPTELPTIELALEAAGAPWTPGRRPLP